MKRIFNHVKSTLFIIYFIGFILALRSAIPAYINSSFLSEIFGKNSVGIIFSICSIFTIFLFLTSQKYLKKYGNYKTIIFLSIINAITVFVLAISNNPTIVLISFVLAYGTGTIIYFCLDIFIEHDSSDKSTGNIRGVYLFSLNLAWLFSPFIAGLILMDHDYWKIFTISGLMMIWIIYLIFTNLKKFKDPEYHTLHIRNTINEVERRKDVKRILFSAFLLNFFYAIMVIYSPIHLYLNIGFDWFQIGEIFTIMLLPFVIFQIPLGKIADKYLGEKELLVLGFSIMAVSTFLIAFISSKNFWLWAGILFLTRLGAAIVEVMSDTYFFKKIEEKNMNLISAYRMTFPISYIIAPLIATVFLMYFDFKYIFVLASIFMVIGVIDSARIKDTL